MTILLILTGAYLYLLLCWALYLAIMNLKRSKNSGTLPDKAKAFGYQLFYPGLFLDLILNLVFGTILFLQLPREGLFTERLNRNINRADWRGVFARWICSNLLNPFDPDGRHCRQPKEEEKQAFYGEH